METYRVANLAGRGGGKTVYLAVLYWLLSISGIDGLKLRASSAQARRLNELFLTITYGTEWPRGTADVSEWTFDVVVTTPAREFVVCRFVFADYPGGDFIDGAARNEDLDAFLQNSDCVYGMLDGANIRQILDGGGSLESLAKDLMRIAQTVDRGTKPIHLLLGKWDVFAGRYDLEDVLALLMRDVTFARIARNCCARDIPLRVVPVSSVGHGFATMQADGTMKKTGAHPQPFNVDKAFACILPDVVEAELSRLLREKEEREKIHVRVDPNLTIWDRVQYALGGAASALRVMLPVRLRMADEILASLSQTLQNSQVQKEDRAIQTEKQRVATLAHDLNAIETERDALRHLLTQMVERRTRLDQEFPDSDVRRYVSRMAAASPSPWSRMAV